MNNFTPKVSIIIPTYNQSKYIKKAIQSALNQDYNNLEVVVSDDNSNDNTFEIVKPLLLQHINLKYFKNPRNIGRVANYNKVLNEYRITSYNVCYTKLLRYDGGLA